MGKIVNHEDMIKLLFKRISVLDMRLAILTDVILSNSSLKDEYDKIANDKTKMDMYRETFNKKYTDELTKIAK